MKPDLILVSRMLMDHANTSMDRNDFDSAKLLLHCSTLINEHIEKEALKDFSDPLQETIDWLFTSKKIA